MAIIPNAFSIRSRIMNHLLERFKEVRAGENGYTVTWNQIKNTPLSRTEILSGNVLGIFDTAETKIPESCYLRCRLTVIIEFFYTVNIGDNIRDELHKMLTDVQRTMQQDIYCGGLSLNIEEVRNELDVSGTADRLVAGMQEYMILYRHAVNDPRRYV